MVAAVKSSSVQVPSIIRESDGAMLIWTTGGYRTPGELGIEMDSSLGSVGLTDYMVGDRPDLGDGVTGYVKGQTPYVPFANNATTQFCQPGTATGKVGDTLLALNVNVLTTAATLTLKDGTGLNGAISIQLLPSPAVVGFQRIVLDDLPSKDGGWSVVAANCSGWLQGNS